MSIAFGIVVGLFLCTVLFFVLFIISIARGAPYVTTGHERVDIMMRFAKPNPGECVADFGSGDGRIVLAFAKAGFETHGFEINPFLVWWSRYQIKKAGLGDKAHIHWKSFWVVHSSSFQVITVYGAQHIMRPLEEKLMQECTPGSRIISNGFRFPTLTPHTQEKNIYCYVL